MPSASKICFMKKALFIFLFVFPTAVYAGATDVRITEIMYDAAGSDTGHEWVELWNGGADPVTIVPGSGSGSWRFNDGANHTFSTTLARGSFILAPGDFLIISSNTDTFLSGHPNFSGNLVKSSFSLGNTLETLFLRLETAGAPWSETNYSSSQGANGNGKTLEWNKTSGAWSESAAVGGTPGTFAAGGGEQVSLPEDIQGGSEVAPPAEQNQPEAPSQEPSYDLTADIRINEFLPDPAGSDMEEWIEIWNQMNRVADLTGWKIDDGEGGSNAFEFPAGSQLLPGSYTLLPRQQTGLQLNNDLDSIRLIRPDGIIKDQVVYGEAPEGSSYAKDGIAWKWNSLLTPGRLNEFAKLSEKIEENVTQAVIEAYDNEHELQRGRKQELASKNIGTVFEGIVTIEPGVLGTQIFYAQNNSRGLQIYMHSKDFPDLRRGSRVRVSGILGIAYGEDRLKVKVKEDIQILEQADELEGQESRIEDLKDEDVGKLILINAEALDTARGKVTIAHEDGDEELEIIWKAGAGEMPDIFPGDKISVIGILKKNKSGFQILPRDSGDLIVEAKKQEQAAAPRGRRRIWFVYAFGAGSVLLSAGLIVQKRNKKTFKS